MVRNEVRKSFVASESTVRLCEMRSADEKLRDRVFHFLDSYGLKGRRILREMVEDEDATLEEIAHHPLFNVSIGTSYNWVSLFYDRHRKPRPDSNRWYRLWILSLDVVIQDEVEEAERIDPHPALELVLANVSSRKSPPRA